MSAILLTICPSWNDNEWILEYEHNNFMWCLTVKFSDERSACDRNFVGNLTNEDIPLRNFRGKIILIVYKNGPYEW